MRHTRATRRFRRWGVGLVAASAGLLTATGVANATVYEVTNGSEFYDAVTDANANPGYDKIVIAVNQAVSPPRNITITDDLLVTADHSHDAILSGTFEGPALSGSAVDIRAQDFVTVAPGVRATFEGIEFNQASDTITGFSVIQNNGSLRLDNVVFVNNPGRPVNSPASSTNVVITNTSFIENFGLGPAVNTGGELHILSSTFQNNFGGGIQSLGSVFELRNTVLQEGPAPTSACYNQPTAGSGNFTTDGTCGNDTQGDPAFEFTFFWTGPTQTLPPTAGSPLIGAGDPAFCPPVDQAFYVRTGACDIGAVQLNGTRDTTPPSCVVTATRRGPDEQDVTVSDTGSGLGPDAVFSEDISITNGSVGFTGLPTSGLWAHPARPGDLVLTAVKDNQSQRTSWGFTARDWAGNERVCE